MMSSRIKLNYTRQVQRLLNTLYIIVLKPFCGLQMLPLSKSNFIILTLKTRFNLTNFEFILIN